MSDNLDKASDANSPERQRAWLASILLQSQRSWFGRFALQLRSLAALRRGQRKHLERKAAVTLAGAALALSLGVGLMRAPAVHAANITVSPGAVFVANDGLCSISEAISSANYDSQIFTDPGECIAGSGADTITLSGGTYTLNASAGYFYNSNTGLPLISTPITIEGNSATIERDSAGGTLDFRIMAVGATGNLTLNNTTLSNGHSTSDGGGLYVFGGYALLNSSSLTGNYAYGDGGGAEVEENGTLIIDYGYAGSNEAYDTGGGLSSVDGSTLTVRNGSAVSFNDATFGGGIYANNSGLVTLDDSTLYANTALNSSGGIGANYSKVVIQNGSTLKKNEAVNSSGGGGSFIYSNLTITDSIIDLNKAADGGGGLILENSNGTIERSHITNNTAVSGALPHAGGGLLNRGQFGNLAIRESTISQNSAGLAGGGIAGIYYAYTLVDSSTIDGNTAQSGGGLLNYLAQMLVINSTISGNSATTTNPNYGVGGGLYGSRSTLIGLSTVTGNTATYAGGGLSFGGGNHTLGGNLVSGNYSNNNGNEVAFDPTAIGTITRYYNVLGDDSETNAEAFLTFLPGSTDRTATADGDDPTLLAGILNPTLANNTGPTMTHALVSGSPALDFVPNGFCSPSSYTYDASLDQRSIARKIDLPFEGNNGTPDVCDAGAFELQLHSVGAFCPVNSTSVRFQETDLLGVGQGSKTKGARTRKLVIPHPGDVQALYGQLASTEVGIMKYVRFLPQGFPKIQIYPPTSPAYRAYAISWWGSDLPLGANYVKGQFFWGAKGNKSPRAFVLWPTYGTDEPHANVFTTFDDSNTNHVAWETGFYPTQTQTIAIPETQDDGATVTVRVAVVDNDKDDRPIFLDVTVGSQTQSTDETKPNRGDTLNIYEFKFENVEIGVDEVRIDMASPVPSALYPDGGDSAAMIGAAVNYDCRVDIAAPPPAPRPDAPAASSNFWATMRARFQQARAAQARGAAGEYSGRFGMWWAQQDGDR